MTDRGAQPGTERLIERLQRLAANTRGEVAQGRVIQAIDIVDEELPRLLAEAHRQSRETLDVEALRNDLLWAMWVLARLGWPGSISDLFRNSDLPSLAAEYEAVRSRWFPDAALAADPRPETERTEP